MARSHRPRRIPLQLEVLEDRLTPATPVLMTNITLPGASSAWDYSLGPFNASAVMSDLDGDGQQEVLTPGGNGQLYAYKYNPTNGQAFIDHVYATGQFTGQMQSTPVVVDLPGGRAVFAGNSNGYVFGWDARTGNILPGWPQSVGAPVNNHNGVYGNLAAGDLDGDGVPEIVATSFNTKVIAFHANGQIMWQFNNDDTIFSGVAIGDLNRDGHLEVVVGGDSSPSQFYWQGGRINVLSADGHREWVKRTDQVIWSAPVLADLQGTGYLDVIVGTGYFYPQPSAAPYPGNMVYALDPQGNDLPGWPYVTGPSNVDARVYSSPAVADLMGNGTLDVVVSDGQGKLEAIGPGGNNNKLWTVQAFPAQNLYTSPIIADINGDNRPDVIIGAEGFLRGFSGASGTKFYDNADFIPHYGAAAVGHFKGGSSYQLAIIGNARDGQGNLLSPSVLSIYNLDPTNLTPPWSQLRRDGNSDVVDRPDSFSTPLINRLYVNALGRNPTAGELSGFWGPLFDHSSSLRDPILGIISSGEARARLINSWYQTYLGRQAEQSGLTNWQAFLASGQTYAANQALIAGSLESFNRAGGTNESWITYLYQTLLGRTPGGGEEMGWVNALAAGQITRPDVVIGFLRSPELTSREVTLWYNAYQPGGQSTPSADNLAAASYDLRRGKLEEQVLADILTSNGDYATTQTEGSWLRAAYQDMLGRAPSANEVVFWLHAFEAGTTFGAVASAIVRSGEYNGVLVDSWFQSYLHRAPSPTERANFVNALNNGTARNALQNSILGSDEYFNNRAGGSVNNYINDVFVDLLGHLPIASLGQGSYWANVAKTNPIRVVLPTTLLTQPEYYQNSISSWFFTLLRRYPSSPADGSRLIPLGTPFGAQDFVNYWNAGGDPAAIQVSILSSPEYINLALTKAFWNGARPLS
jgi:hypothetical protein